jgi:ketosteroid isomerase-like protein
MRMVLIVALGATLCASRADAQERDLVKLYQRLLDAFRAKDTATLARLWTDGYLFTDGATGRLSTKPDRLRIVAEIQAQIDTLTLDSMTVHVDRDLAVGSALVREIATEGGVRSRETIRATVVFVRTPRQGWRIAATHTSVPSSDAASSAGVADSVRAFMETVAREVTRDGPAAWRRQFADDAAFFMAAEGRLVFPSAEAAANGIDELTRVIAHIELRWGNDVRVDPLGPGLAMVGASYTEVRADTAGHRVEEAGFFTGLAEHRAVGWRFRDAHWSVVGPPPMVR